MIKPIEQVKTWTDNVGHEFELLRVWNPNEEPDPWAEYTNPATGQVYTCRMAAFQARFSPRLD